MSKNPFRPYPTSRGPVKLLLYGDPGTQKTRRALTMPGPRFMVDLEKGADEYGDLAQPGDQYMACQSHAGVMEALAFLSTQKDVGTLIIDPITVVWQSLQAGHAERQSRKKKIAPEDVMFDQGVWSRLNRAHNDMVSVLLNAPYHVVMIARGKETKDNDGNVVGYGYEGHKAIEFLAKTVIVTRRAGDLVLKDRSGTWQEGTKGRLDLRDLLKTAGSGGEVLETATDAAERDADPDPDALRRAKHHPSWAADQRSFFAEVGRLGLNGDLVCELAEQVSLKKLRPSAMDPIGRAKFVGWLATDIGRAAYDGLVEAREIAARESA